MIRIKTFFTIAAFISLFLIACGENDKSNADVSVPSTSSAPLLPSTNIQATPIDSATLLRNEAGVALNPQHGQPGHRCDIAVGAPLNSAPNTANIQVAPPPTTATVPATTANTANLKLNPKHGEPGHRCDIAVGAPLDGTKK